MGDLALPSPEILTGGGPQSLPCDTSRIHPHGLCSSLVGLKPVIKFCKSFPRKGRKQARLLTPPYPTSDPNARPSMSGLGMAPLRCAGSRARLGPSLAHHSFIASLLRGRALGLDSPLVTIQESKLLSSHFRTIPGGGGGGTKPSQQPNKNRKKKRKQ